MKSKLKLLIFGLMLSVGCGRPTVGNISGIEVTTPGSYANVWITFATNGTERFAIVTTSNGGVSICQIKDEAK